jgi:transitional endoplasmic reticulum ATPase
MAILSNNQQIGNYEVKRLIKENLYCETYRVEDADEEPFFLKIFVLKNTPTKMIDDDGWLRYINLSKRLCHKNIISFVECGTYQNEEVGECQYVVTNYCNGELLADKLQREGKLPLEESLQIFQNILDGLKYMHHQDILHNDITPRNIMLSERTGEAELIDLSHVSTYVKGAPPFDTSDLDLRYHSLPAYIGIYNCHSDLFSAVGVLYTMLSGRVPWDVTLPEDTDRKTRLEIIKKAREVPLPTDYVSVPSNIYRILKNGLIVKGTCIYSSVDSLRNDMQDSAVDHISDKKDPKPTEEPKQAATSENELQMKVQKGGGNGFRDIAGMDQLKQMLTQKVIFILKDKEKAAKYKILPPNGMLFYGPPGCGKSFFAEKFAEETGFNFMLVKASDLGSIYVHGSQGKIADLFKKAEENKPTIICFDEFDAFVPNRSNTGAEHQAGEVNEFLSQLNNCAQRGIFVIATSNRPDMIDPAVLRTGRIDKLVYVPMPDKDARREMFKIHLNGRPCEDLDMEHLAELTDGYIASDIAYIVNDAAMGAAFSDKPITQQLLEETIGSIHPSLSKEVVNSYENMRQKMEDADIRNRRPKIGFIQ